MLYVATAAASALTALCCAAAVLWRLRARRAVDTEATRTILRTAALAATDLRKGLSRDSARLAVRHLRALVGGRAVALVDTESLLAWSGPDAGHAAASMEFAAASLRDARPHVDDRLDCAVPGCPVRAVITVPLVVDGTVVGALLVFTEFATASLVDAATELAHWASGQLELAELAETRARLADVKLRALRLQISPHFVYNCLTTIASFVRTDPVRARGLLLDFADFARYSFRGARNLTTLDEELRAIDHYLALERARFGDRLRLTVRVAPEVLNVEVPFLCLQPLVENAVRHGLEGRPGGGSISVIARDAGAEARISVEDDGAGIAPDHVSAILAGRAAGSDGIGLANVDERMRAMFGDAYGLVVETERDAGTKVNLRIPKFRHGGH
ncbi:sensor histidine kinase [Murinocardiopsis flavida]|nr:histidine kinase [Murinocardiopsis flavida]